MDRGWRRSADVKAVGEAPARRLELLPAHLGGDPTRREGDRRDCRRAELLPRAAETTGEAAADTTAVGAGQDASLRPCHLEQAPTVDRERAGLGVFGLAVGG